MQSGYEIKWTPNALEELKATFEYLEKEFSKKELNKLSTEIEYTIHLLAQNPFLFRKSESLKVYRVVILKFNSMFYRVRNKEVEILSFFSNRQDPNKIRIK